MKMNSAALFYWRLNPNIIVIQIMKKI